MDREALESYIKKKRKTHCIPYKKLSNAELLKLAKVFGYDKKAVQKLSSLDGYFDELKTEKKNVKSMSADELKRLRTRMTRIKSIANSQIRAAENSGHRIPKHRINKIKNLNLLIKNIRTEINTRNKNLKHPKTEFKASTGEEKMFVIVSNMNKDLRKKYTLKKLRKLHKKKGFNKVVDEITSNLNRLARAVDELKKVENRLKRNKSNPMLLSKIDKLIISSNVFSKDIMSNLESLR